MGTLDNLKKEAKRWLKALRTGDREARARLSRVYPKAPPEPALRHVQHALALEHGLPGWSDLKRRVAVPAGGERHADRAGWFLEQACPDWRLGGPGEQAAAEHAAVRLLDRHPEIAQDSIYTMVVCGALAGVERALGERPEAATGKGGVKGWEPLHYLCFARLPLPEARDNAVAIARLLLDHGADPNGSFVIGNARHTPLVGIIGGGEENRAPHPQADALVRLLLERGADAYDRQVVYNVNQDERHDPCRWPELLYEHSLKIGRESDWTEARRSTALHGLGAFDWLLCEVVRRGDLQRAEWLMSRGANPNVERPWAGRSLHEEAVRAGATVMADLLVRFGAIPSVVNLDDEEVFTAACLRLDRDQAQEMLRRHPEYLRSPAALFAAARQDRPEVVAFLFDLGVPMEIEDAQRQRALHVAAGADALRVAQLLIDRGAEVDPHETEWDTTPLGYAMYGEKEEMIALLSRYSRDVFRLASLGAVDRLREVLSTQPELARAKDGSGATPLMWIRDDRRALEVIELLLSCGADPAVRLKDGTTALDLLIKRGLDEAAAALRWRMRGEVAAPDHAQRVAAFLRMACLDWRVGGVERARQTHAAGRLLQRHPEIAGDSLLTAVVYGDLERVEAILAAQPAAASEPGGPRGWPPLLYLCNARLPFRAASENAVAIARALLDHGADPNAYYPGGDPTIHYSALTSVLGRGEEQATMHPQAEALARMLLERGAEPYDVQVLYNMFAGHASQRHLGDEALWLMDLIHSHSLARGREADWKDPDWPMLGMGGYGCGARYLLGNAIAANHPRLVEWLLAHGANPNAPSGKDRPAFKDSLYEDALRRGLTEIADLLRRRGATTDATRSDDEEAYVVACLNLDGASARRLLASHPEYLQWPRPMALAAQNDRADVVALLLDLGVSPDVEDPRAGRARPLHQAAYHDAPRVAQLLIDRGAEIDFFDDIHDGTALWWAVWGQKPRMVDMLSRLSRDVWSLTVAGKVERLREVLAAEPRLAKATYQGQTPLFLLPDDEASALAIAELFLAHGADPAVRNARGQTAADRAVERGLAAAAEVLRVKRP